MTVKCGMSSIKYILFFFNTIFIISGLSIILTGALILSDVKEFKHFLEEKFLAPSILFIIVGIVVFAIAFFGCYGTIKEQHNLLIVFVVALLIMFIVELAIGIAVAVYKNDFDNIMKTALKDSMQKYSESKIDETTWDNVQRKFHCCGVETSSDWQHSDPNRFSHGLPPSCCQIYTGSTCANSQFEAYPNGCFPELETKVQKNAKILIGVILGIVFIEVAGLISIYFVSYTIKMKNKE